MGPSYAFFACLIGSLPGPPGFKIEHNYFQALPLDKITCPIDPNRDITFKLFTRNNPHYADVLRIDDDEALQKSNMNFSDPTVIFFHGYFESSEATNSIEIRNAYLQKAKHNVIIVNAKRMTAGPWYVTSARNTLAVGKYTARFIDYLVQKGFNLSSLHLVGVSLGAHMAGNTGSNVQSGVISRITGLDPAGPLFIKWPKKIKLDQSDAKFVDVIHTDAGIFGYPTAIGHADFWPNGGISPQPGCLPSEIRARDPEAMTELVFCSHWRSYQFYAESVMKEDSFLAVSCESWANYKMEKCSSNETVHMGLGLSYGVRGNFYLKTKPSRPFSL